MKSLQFKKALDSNNYQEQGYEFLRMTGTIMEVKWLEYAFHFDGDTDKRNIYEITLKRGNREYSFNYGNSIQQVLDLFNIRKSDGKPFVDSVKKNSLRVEGFDFKEQRAFKNMIKKAQQESSFPTAYDVLACLTKYDPESFEDFCDNFGYDEDSRKAEKTYKAVKEEYTSLLTLFNDKEMELLQEIN